MKYTQRSLNISDTMHIFKVPITFEIPPPYFAFSKCEYLDTTLQVESFDEINRCWCLMFSLLVDKLSLTFTIPEDENKNDHFSCVLNQITILGQEKHLIKKAKHATKCIIKLSDGNKLMVQAGISHHKLYIKFEFNPTKLSPQEWGDLYLHMALFLDFGYNTLYKHGKISYIEVAADSKNIGFDDIFVYDAKIRKSNNKFKEQGTIYLGSETSQRSFIVYDKRKELYDNKGIKLDHPITRIEARLSNLSLTLEQLHKLTNPFSSLHVGWAKDLLQKNGDEEWKTFKKRFQTMDTQSALGMAGNARKKILNTLSEITTPELSPKEYWDQFPAAIKILEPPPLPY